MLGRFVIPAARLGELEPFAALFAERPPFAIAALGRGGDAAAFVEGLREDLREIGALEKRHPGRAVVDVLEVKWPSGAPAGARNLVESAAACVEQHDGPLTLTPYFEIGLSGDWRATVTAFVTELKHFREDRAFRRRTKCRPPGMKLRCGGLDET